MAQADKEGNLHLVDNTINIILKKASWVWNFLVNKVHSSHSLNLMSDVDRFCFHRIKKREGLFGTKNKNGLYLLEALPI